MADEKEKSSVLGIRLEPEEKKRFEDFVKEESKNNKEFLSTLLNIYELNKGKTKNINLVGDINLLEQCTNQIQKVFIGIIDKLEVQKEEITENNQNELQIYKDKVNDLQNKVDGITLVNSTIEDKLTNVNNVMLTIEGKNKSLTESLQDKLTIIEEYKGKNDTLTGLLNEYKQSKVDAEEYKKLLADSQSKNIEIRDSIKDKDISINSLNKDLEKAKAENQKELNQLREKHIQELQTLTEKLDIEKDKAIILKDKEHQAELKKVHDEYDIKINRYQAENDNYNAKYLGLLEQMEKRTKTAAVQKK